MAKTASMPDPATEGEFKWTKADIDKAMQILGQQMMNGKFNSQSWEGEDFKLTFADGKTRTIIPKYFGYVYSEWQKRQQ